MQSSNVLIISDDVEFSRRIISRWQAEPSMPAFTILSGDLWPRTVENFAVAIVGPLRPEILTLILEPLHATSQPLFCIYESGDTVATVRRRWPRTATLAMTENWVEGLILAAAEAVQRAAAESRARLAEHTLADLQREATLGRYMLEMRHGLNNALTSLLGNSDLLLIEPGNVTPQALGQIETIRDMTLRIHEVMRRFSSLENEMNVAAREAERESGKWRVAMAGKS